MSTNHGTLGNGAGFGAGRFGQGFTLNGVGGIDVPDSAASAFGTNDFSIVLWANFADTSGRRSFIASDNGGGSQEKWIFWLDNGNIIFHMNGASGDVDLGVVPFTTPEGLWHHFAVTRRGSAYSFFTNGV
ncbi:MAG TPA: LamG-like jellyroll fold domain-containing protein, partial [Verrucomicrobiae bacterium]|nr:LamG-like jellyroll fold domain-containing protein [Verrucomicrobiae bacterium]